MITKKQKGLYDLIKYVHIQQLLNQAHAILTIHTIHIKCNKPLSSEWCKLECRHYPCVRRVLIPCENVQTFLLIEPL